MPGPTHRPNGCSCLHWLGASILLLAVSGVILTVLTSQPSVGDRKSSAQLGCKSLETAIEAYIQDKANPKQEFPTTPNDLFEPLFGGTPFLRNGQADLLDPWGKPYEFERARRFDGTEYILVKTTAPDGTPISQFGIGKNAKPAK